MVLPVLIALPFIPAATDLIASGGTRIDLAALQVPVLVGGLLVFGVVFAMNSSLHSYLIVAYSDADRIALNVGFYYMANAIGRFAGTFLSGLLYQVAGLPGALLASSALLALAVAFTLALPRPAAASGTAVGA
jgi:hypothetical protein